MSDSENKSYMGDSVYAEFDGYVFMLTTENGAPGDPSNAIYMEPAVIDALVGFRQRVTQPQPAEEES